MKRLLCVLLAFCLLFPLSGCREKAPEGEYALQGLGQEVPTTGNARVYYQIFVGSFSDSNGDGIGDLRGIINRFDYLNDGIPNSGKSLGVEGIWLSPILISPSYHKYDVADYYTIDPQFGTEEDLKELIALCHERNVQIILDTVINHTSTQHPWFQKFHQAHKQGNTQDPYYDYYVYTDKPGGNASYSILLETNVYYESNFSYTMPELNFDNPAVRQDILDMSRYYLDLGVDGFRFDAAKYIYFGDEGKNATFWDWYMTELRSIKKDIYTVAEVWDSDIVAIPYSAYTNCFNFSMSQQNGQIAWAAKYGNIYALTAYVDEYLDEIQALRSDAMLISFIANHDMDRAAGYLPDNNGLAEMAANLLLWLPGSSFIYYGEEIGMIGSRGGSSTDANRRLAMLWGDGDTVKNPIGSSYSAQSPSGTVQDQLPDSGSLYNHYKKLIAARKANPEIANGTFTPLELVEGKVGGFLSEYQGKTVAVIHNAETESVTIDLSKYTDLPFASVAACVGLGAAKLEGSILTLGGQTSVILR